MDTNSDFLILRRHLLKVDHHDMPIRVAYTFEKHCKGRTGYVTRHLNKCGDSMKDLIIEEITNSQHVKTYLPHEWLQKYQQL